MKRHHSQFGYLGKSIAPPLDQKLCKLAKTFICKKFSSTRKCQLHHVLAILLPVCFLVISSLASVCQRLPFCSYYMAHRPSPSLFPTMSRSQTDHRCLAQQHHGKQVLFPWQCFLPVFSSATGDCTHVDWSSKGRKVDFYKSVPIRACDLPPVTFSRGLLSLHRTEYMYVLGDVRVCLLMWCACTFLCTCMWCIGLSNIGGQSIWRALGSWRVPYSITRCVETGGH